MEKKRLTDKLDYLTLLRMKALIKNKKAGFEWKIKTFGYKDTLFLDDGDQSYFNFTFDLRDYTEEEVINIGMELAKDLGVPFK